MSEKKKKLGSNPLAEIMNTIDSPRNEIAINTIDDKIDGKKIRYISIEDIEPDPDQPRKDIDHDSDEIKELSESIKSHSFIHFITVREREGGKYIIVTGERRFWAAKRADLKEIPVIITSTSQEECALIQLEENIHRQDLTAIEEAEAYVRLMTEFEKQQKDIVKLIKKPKSYVSQMMSLKKLSTEIKEEVRKTSVARRVLWDLASLSEDEQKVVWNKIKKEPTINAFEKVKQSLQKEKVAKNEVNEEELQKAIEWAYKEKKISDYISAVHQRKLMEDFSQKDDQ